MKWRFIKIRIIAAAGMFALMAPALVSAQSEPAKTTPPPIGQQLVREGAFALALAEKLEVITTNDEVEAESKLGEIGISPRNGWIADYPVTPDIIAELQAATAATADADKLNIDKPEALKRFEQVNNEVNLAVRPYSSTDQTAATPQSAGNYPDPTIINNYYTEQGPPVVTYYAPPADYYYLYGWVPSPFWCFGFWFPGFFILNDFHRVAHFHGRPVFISNHFNDISRHRVFRVDPVRRFEGRTFSGIGAVRSRGAISTGVPRSERRIFNGPRNVAPRGPGQSGASFRGGRSISSPSRGGSPAMRGNASPGRGAPRMGTAPGRGSAPARANSGGAGRSGGGGGSSPGRMERR